MPATAGSMTYAVGRVFLQHFESGGTFLNFNPEEVKEHYARLFEEGKKVVAEVKEEINKPTEQAVPESNDETVQSDEELINDNNIIAEQRRKPDERKRRGNKSSKN